jgi:hypothetical protein
MLAKEVIKHLENLIEKHGDIPVYIMQYDGGGENEHELLCEPKFFLKGISNQDYQSSIQYLPDRVVIEG